MLRILEFCDLKFVKYVFCCYILINLRSQVYASTGFVDLRFFNFNVRIPCFISEINIWNWIFRKGLLVNLTGFCLPSLERDSELIENCKENLKEVLDYSTSSLIIYFKSGNFL